MCMFWIVFNDVLNVFVDFYQQQQQKKGKKKKDIKSTYLLHWNVCKWKGKLIIWVREGNRKPLQIWL